MATSALISLEQDLHRELDNSGPRTSGNARSGSGRRLGTGDLTIGSAEYGIGRAESHTVGEIERFGSKLNARRLARAELSGNRLVPLPEAGGPGGGDSHVPVSSQGGSCDSSRIQIADARGR